MGRSLEIDSDQWRQTVIEGARTLGLAVTVEQSWRMQEHALQLLHWNRVTNLTAITDPLEVAVKHYVDSVAAEPWIGQGVRVLDAGSGGGFPGIPLKIVRPDVTVCMVDSVRKKVSFLKHAIRTLGLRDMDAVHGRLEILGELPSHLGQFDLVVCRAFSSLEDFVTLTTVFLAPGGSLLALKGPLMDHAHETTLCDDHGTIRLGGKSFSMHTQRYRLPFLDSQRRLVKLTPLAQAG